jgi:hypothetical protein
MDPFLELEKANSIQDEEHLEAKAPLASFHVRSLLEVYLTLIERALFI